MKPELLVMRILQSAVLILCGCLAAPHPGRAQLPPALPTAEQQAELRILTRMLAEPDRTAKTKAEAAGILLTRPYPQAAKTLAGFLGDSTNVSAQVSVAKAIAETGMGKTEFVDPLFAMLASEDGPVRLAAAAALGTYKDQSVPRRLVTLVTDAKVAQTVRTAAISALSGLPEKRSGDTLISLLKDPDPVIGAAAAEALAKLTGIRSFGIDAARWRAWWQENKNKTRQQWLADLANSLSRQNAKQERQLVALREQLALAMAQWHAATPTAQQPGLQLTFLRHQLADVRLIGLSLATQSAAAGTPPAEGAATVVRGLLNDEDWRVRASAATLAGTLNGEGSAAVVLKRLQTEDIPAVRTALVAAIGVMKAPGAIDALLTTLAKESNGTAVAAAVAIEQVVAANRPTEAQAAIAVNVLTARYRGSLASQPQLRQALLGAMRTLGRPEFVAVMRKALQDSVAAVRLAAVRGLQETAGTDAGEQIAALLGEPADVDRGVRQAAIVALGATGEVKYLDAVLRHTHPKVESDPTVQQQAWKTALALLAKADTQRVAAEAEALAGRADAHDRRIDILAMLVARLSETPDKQVSARLDLASALQAADRPAEAAKVLAAAYQTAQTGPVWIRWMGALLAADDAACLAHMAQQTDAALRGQAITLLTARLTALTAEKQHQTLIALADQALARLGQKLSTEQTKAIGAIRTGASAALANADGARVEQLAKELASADPAVRAKAVSALTVMGKRAIEPLIKQLRSAVDAPTPKPDWEAAIAAVLARLNPKLTGYDPKASPNQKRKTIDGWPR